MKIVIDENIAFAKEAFSDLGEMHLVNGRLINNRILKNADILIVRSITKVNEELLRDTGIRFVGTATTGDDHIDKSFLLNTGIRFAGAKGCNAFSVAEYMFCALAFAFNAYGKEKFKSVGIVGYGNIGKKVASIVKSLGLDILVNDPPLQRLTEDKPRFKDAGHKEKPQNDDVSFVGLKDALNADIVTFHTPLIIGGIDNSYHLLNRENINFVKKNALLINSSRGEVIDNNMLLEVKGKLALKYILDVWENEPIINPSLLEISEIGTPHIAGYSLEGKINGTKMIYDELCNFLNIPSAWNPYGQSEPNTQHKINKKEIHINDSLSETDFLYNLSKCLYDIKFDSDNLKKDITCFDKLRKEYRQRPEFVNYFITLSEKQKKYKPLLDVLRIENN